MLTVFQSNFSILSFTPKCIFCNLKMCFVNASRRAISHFRHLKDTCEIVTGNKKFYENYQENVMSKFHINWQEIFPNNNIEVVLKNNNKIYRADIHVKTTNKFNEDTDIKSRTGKG